MQLFFNEMLKAPAHKNLYNHRVVKSLFLQFLVRNCGSMGLFIYF
jgi:hypothetical protein